MSCHIGSQPSWHKLPVTESVTHLIMNRQDFTKCSWWISHPGIKFMHGARKILAMITPGQAAHSGLPQQKMLLNLR
jgi:hypothetical protein